MWKASRLLMVLLVSACSYVPTTRLEYEPAAAAGPRLPVSLAVEPLVEDRPPRFYPSYGGRVFLSYVPLLPWVKIPYERPEESYLKAHGKPEPWADQEEHFTRKIAESINDDLRGSAMFREVRFVDRGESWDDADLVLGGRLRSTELDVYVTSYLLGVPGVLLWILPIPIGRNAASVEIELELRDRAGAVVWSQRTRGRAGKLFWLYSSNGKVSGEFGLEIYRYGGNREGIDPNSLWAYHAGALRQAMDAIKPSLRSAVDLRLRTIEERRQ